MDISLITVVGDCVDVLPQMLAHYRSLGIRKFTVHAHAPVCGHPSLRRIAKIADDAGIRLASVTTGRWMLGHNTTLYSMSRMERPNDWFLLADQDELQVYPDDLKDILRFCDRRGYDFVEGCMVDRITESGKLARVSPRRSLWEQFPMGAIVTPRILGAVANKIVAAKGHVRISTGQHHAQFGTGAPPSEIYVPVHHFKWVEGLLPRLQSRTKAIQLKGLYGQECARFLAHYSANGRIQLEDPSLLAGRCEPNYPHFEILRQWRIAAPYFSSDLAARQYLPHLPGSVAKPDA